MSYFISINRIPYEEPFHLDLQFEFETVGLKAAAEVYLSTKDLENVGLRLKDFPAYTNQVFLFEQGSERSEDSSIYFRLRVIQTDEVGHCAIHIVHSNGQEFPDYRKFEFCIAVDPARINRLGGLLEEFSRLTTQRLVWSDEEAYIR